MITKDRKVTIDHDLVIGHTYEVAVRAIAADGRVEAVALAPKATLLLSGVVRGPGAPSALSVDPYLFTIFLTWTNPTDSDFDVTEVWRNTVDVRATATKIGEVRTDSFADLVGSSGVTEYYWIRSRNTSGVVGEWNAAAGTAGTTTGVTATDIADFAVTATKMYNNTVILTGDTWTNNSPTAGKIAWNAHTIVHNGASTAISAGNTINRYVYWIVGNTSYSTSTTHPTLGATGYMIATNEAGVTQPVWNSSANMVIGTAFILNAAITNAKIDDLAVTDAKINDLAVSKLTAGTISSKAITLAVAAGTGDVYVAAGKTDFTNTDAGFILGVDDSDADKAKFYIGDSTKFLNWDGAALTVQGKIQTAGGTGKRMVLDDADNTLKFYNESNVNVIKLDDDVVGNRPGLWIGDATNGAAVYVYKDATHWAHLIEGQLEVYSAYSDAAVYGISTHASHTDGILKTYFLGGNGRHINCYTDGTGTVFEVDHTGIANAATSYKVAGTKVVGAQGAAVADATDAASVILRLNDLLARCRAHGLIAT